MNQIALSKCGQRDSIFNNSRAEQHYNHIHESSHTEAILRIFFAAWPSRPLKDLCVHLLITLMLAFMIGRNLHLIIHDEIIAHISQA